MVEPLRVFKKKFSVASELVWLSIALVISVTAITSVSFLADRLQQSFSQNARELIAADTIVRGDQLLDTSFEKKAKELGLRTSKTVIFSTMMRTGNESKLVSLKAVSNTYPLRGKLSLTIPGAELKSGQVWLDPQIANIYQIKLGDAITLGEKVFIVSNLILREPDRGAGFMNFAPRVMIHEMDLSATQLLGLGSRASYRLLVATEKVGEARTPSNGALTQYNEWAKKHIEQANLRGVSLEDIENGQPLLRKTIDQANRFLSLVALLTGMVAAVGIAIASRRYAKKQIVSTLVKRCFGASTTQILKTNIYLFLKIMLYAGLLGILLGYGLQEILIRILQSLLDKNLPSPSIWPVVWGFLVAFILMLGFAFPPLIALTQVSPNQVLRKDNITLSFNYFITAGFGILSYCVLLIWIAHNLRIGILILGGFIGACFIYACVSYFLCRGLGKKLGSRISRLSGIRYSAQRVGGDPSWISFQITTLGIAMLAILLLIVIRFNVLDAWQASVPPEANNRFILNVLPDQKNAVQDFLKQELRQPDYDAYPMIRGRLTAINQRAIRGSNFEDQNTQRLVEREFNLSYASHIPVKNKVIAGEWFTSSDPMQVSMEAGMMKSLKLKLGDELNFDIAGKDYRVKITSVRKLDWNSMRVNFFAMMPRELLQDAPQSWIMAFRQESDQRIDMDIVRQYPNITALNIQDSIAQAQDILLQLIFAIQALFLFTLIAGFIVLIISLISIQEQRIREVAILKTLGADQKFLMRVWLFELLLCGSVAGILSGTFASFAGWYISNQLLEIDMQFPYWIILVGVILGVSINGIASYWLRQKTMYIAPMMILKS